MSTTKKKEQVAEASEKTNVLQQAVEKATNKSINLNELRNDENTSANVRRKARELQEAIAEHDGVFERAAANQIEGK